MWVLGRLAGYTVAEAAERKRNHNGHNKIPLLGAAKEWGARLGFKARLSGVIQRKEGSVRGLPPRSTPVAPPSSGYPWHGMHTRKEA